MGIGVSVFLIALGAVLLFAVNLPTQGLDLNAVGLILMVVGFVGLLLFLLFWGDYAPWSRRRTVVRERDPLPSTHADERRTVVRERIVERDDAW